MQTESIESTNFIGLHTYEAAIKDIISQERDLITAAEVYKLHVANLSKFISEIYNNRPLIKGRTFSPFDEQAFLLYIKLRPQPHCVCATCLKEYLPLLLYKFISSHSYNYPQSWDTRRQVDEFMAMRFLERNSSEISRLFSSDCLRVSTNNLYKRSLNFLHECYECPSCSPNNGDCIDNPQRTDSNPSQIDEISMQAFKKYTALF